MFKKLFNLFKKGENKCRMCVFSFDNMYSGWMCKYDVEYKGALDYRRCRYKNPRDKCKDFKRNPSGIKKDF
jgi:hypothetical protein